MIEEIENPALQNYVAKAREMEKRKARWSRRPDVKINELYDQLEKSGKITCTDDPGKETKIDRILTIKSNPSADFTYRDVNIDPDVLDTMENDWDYSSKNKMEIFRMLCLDTKSGKTKITTSRVEGSATSVKGDYGMCEKDFPGKDVIPVGSFHTHPDYFDRPLESIGDMLAFASNENETFSCTGTKWGTTCMFRMKEPALIFDIPKVKPGGDPKKPEVETDATGKTIYEVKSDSVDWNRVMKFSSRFLTNAIHIVARGTFNRDITGALSGVAWFKPDDVSRSIGVVEAPNSFGVEKAEPRTVTNLTCESFVDIYGTNAKVRTVCDDGTGKEPFYVESAIAPARLFFFKNKGFPTNFYTSRGVKMKTIFPLPKEESKYWDRVDKNARGYHKTRSEATDELIGVQTEKSTTRSSQFTLDGTYICEYLLLPLEEGKDESGKGKPAGILCRESIRDAMKKTCVLT